MKKLLKLAVGAVLAGFIGFGTANAATFDFVAIADSGVGPFYGEKGGDPLSFTSGALTLDVTGTKDGGSAFAYLDKSANPPSPISPAGMGVCGVLDGNDQCSPGSDDQVQQGEVLTLTFSEEVTTTEWGFNGPNHGNTFVAGHSLLLSVDGGTFMSMALDDPTFAAFNGLTGTTFAIMWENVDLYLAQVSVVPLPPAAFLFAAALAGLGWLGRRRKV